MKQNENNTSNWIADEGKTFIRKIDNIDFGSEIYLGINDSIENYVEVSL